MGIFFKRLFATLLGFFFATLLLIASAIGLVAYLAWTFSSSSLEIKQGTLLEINMSETITDSPRPMPLFDISTLSVNTRQELSLLSLLRGLERAAVDPSITAISLRFDGDTPPSLAIAEELREALVGFKQSSQKPIYAYAESYSQVEYYIASIADKISIHPLGSVEWQGVATNSIYYGDLLQHLGVGVEIFRPRECLYKSAVEPFTRNSMSKESREQNQRLVDTIWDGLLGQLTKSRGISNERLREFAATQIVVESDSAKEWDMVDEVAYLDEYEAQLEERGVVRERGGGLRRVTMANYSMGEMVGLGGDKIAVIYLDGVIVDGESSSGSGAEMASVGSQSIANELRRARCDKSVKGVVVRVNSPGGSAMAADVIWREMVLLKAQKPLIVSMGGYAASGGYYISAPADMIIADRYTITGSIGVYGAMFAYDEALKERLRIAIDGVESEPSADFGRTPRSLNAVERAAMMRGVDRVYDSFLNKVSSGRNLPRGVVSVLGGGRVWSGVEAESMGLVDGVGGLKLALSFALDRSGIDSDNYEVVEWGQPQQTWEAIMGSLSSQISSRIKSTILPTRLEATTSRMVQDLETLTSAADGILLFDTARITF